MADLTALAENAVETLSVPEFHGVVCGLSVWQADDFSLQELIDLVGVDALTDESSVEVFVSAALAALAANDMSFAPLLPADDVDLALRVEGLAEWCAGFLAGFGAAGANRGLQSVDRLPDDVREIVGDLSAITQLDVDGLEGSGDAGSEASESDLVELQEFVKVGVLLIASLVAQSADDPAQ
jgi:uncharacterized protein YgfB (UPF0149 family)